MVGLLDYLDNQLPICRLGYTIFHRRRKWIQSLWLFASVATSPVSLSFATATTTGDAYWNRSVQNAIPTLDPRPVSPLARSCCRPR